MNFKQHSLGVMLFIATIFLPWYFADIILPPLAVAIRWLGDNVDTLLICHQICISLSIDTIYTALYWLELPAVEKHKTNNVPWPWQIDPHWRRLASKTAALFIVNQIFVGWLGVQVKMLIFDNEPIRTSLEDLPSFPVMVSQVVFFTLCEDFFAFAAHVLLHHPLLYKRIHKVHHEYFNTIAYSVDYMHPIETLFSELVAKNAGPVMMGGKAHILTIMVYLILQSVESAECHSGYSFPFAVAPTKHLPFAAPASFHNHHHLINNGNFANTFVFWDAIFGTTSIYYFENIEAGLLKDE